MTIAVVPKFVGAVSEEGTRVIMDFHTYVTMRHNFIFVCESQTLQGAKRSMTMKTRKSSPRLIPSGMIKKAVKKSS